MVREAGQVGGKLLQRERTGREFLGKDDGRLGEGEHARGLEPGDGRLDAALLPACKGQDFGVGEFCGLSLGKDAAASVRLVAGQIGPHVGDPENPRELEEPDCGKLSDRDEAIASGYLRAGLRFVRCVRRTILPAQTVRLGVF